MSRLSSIARLSRMPWKSIADVVLRIIIWLLLGSAINLFPVLIAYMLGVGQQETGRQNNPLTTILATGDLLIAAAAMLPPTLADLALNVKKAKRTRTLVVIVGAFVALTSLVFYGFAFANDLSREAHKAPAAIGLSANSVATWSIAFFVSAVVLGAVCAAFLAAGEPSSAAAEPSPVTQEET